VCLTRFLARTGWPGFLQQTSHGANWAVAMTWWGMQRSLHISCRAGDLDNRGWLCRRGWPSARRFAGIGLLPLLPQGGAHTRAIAQGWLCCLTTCCHSSFFTCTIRAGLYSCWLCCCRSYFLHAPQLPSQFPGWSELSLDNKA